MFTVIFKLIALFLSKIIMHVMIKQLKIINLIAHTYSLITLISNGSCEKNQLKLPILTELSYSAVQDEKTLQGLNLHPKESRSSNV